MQTKIEKDKESVRKMIGIYCRGKHKSPKGTLCPACSELNAYAERRLTHCRYQEEKGYCSHCPTHCYNKEMRSRIREVMKYSGMRLIFINPFAPIKHFIDGFRSKGKKPLQKLKS